MTATTTPAADAASVATNEVLLRGRVSAEPGERELPSGDTIMTLRVVVDRPAQRPKQPVPRQRVDAIDCVVWNGRIQRNLRAWKPGDQVEVQGAIRRRFFRGATGVVSRVEVEVTKARRLTSAGDC